MKHSSIAALFVVIPLLAPPLASAQALTHVEPQQVATVFTYTLFNDEPLGSPLYLSSFHLTVDAPVDVVACPDGWTFVTDGTTYVDWFVTDPSSPYEHDLAPATALPGFGIQSTVVAADLLGYNSTFWDHVNDTSVPGTLDTTLAPVLVIVFFCTPDFNNDGDLGTDADIEAFFACLGGNCCPTCGSADFNGDGDVGTDADLESFFRVLAGGSC